ncbi:MAG: restriction endonuclease subunit S [Methylococcales bacterium]|nr:restriction endonuclease subunit S [Methylococcales bacterium]MDD5631112.1 restriction endonuclease subunit S [Methylococcales bacterium]
MNKGQLVVEELSAKYQMAANNSGLRKGYKQTEVGVIPDDWEVRNLGTAIDKLETGVSVNSVDESQRVYAHEQSILKTSAVANGQFYAHEAKKIAPRDIARAKLNPRADTIIISRMNTPDLVGESGYVEIDNANLFLPDRLWMTRIRQGSDICVKWLSYLLVTERYKRKVKESATGTSGSMKNISKDVFLSLQIPYPSGEEQRAIAAVLSDVDALLAKLDQLISKKRDLKLAAMQQLLTGQTRLQGFREAWEIMPMKVLGNTYGGLTGKTKVDFGQGDARYIPFMNVMTYTIIDPSWLEHVDVESDEAQNLTKKGDLFFNGSSETPEEVGFCAVLLEDIPNLYLNSFCFGFRFKADAKVNGLFFAYWFRSKEGRKAMAVLAQGATRYNIAKSAFMRLEISQPLQEEQTAIATILSDMDAEITGLETRRDKTKDLKQGMMQELLTGRIRLI